MSADFHLGYLEVSLDVIEHGLDYSHQGILDEVVNDLKDWARIKRKRLRLVLTSADYLKPTKVEDLDLRDFKCKSRHTFTSMDQIVLRTPGNPDVVLKDRHAEDASE